MQHVDHEPLTGHLWQLTIEFFHKWCIGCCDKDFFEFEMPLNRVTIFLIEASVNSKNSHEKHSHFFELIYKS